MKKAVEKIKEIIFGHVGICILLLCALPLLFISHGIFGEIEVEQVPSELSEEDLIVVGVSQLGSESGWRTA
ncbi:MAG: LacI family transcriptional regulator, partial [Lachnospiraceae bacterium]|nr:LacI family transcriptional regulator [Lachnospiraceae bacterium]